MDCECNFESIRGRGLQQIIREMTTHFFEHRIKDAVVEKYIDSDTYRVFSFEDPVTGEIPPKKSGKVGRAILNKDLIKTLTNNLDQWYKNNPLPDQTDYDQFHNSQVELYFSKLKAKGVLKRIGPSRQGPFSHNLDSYYNSFAKPYNLLIWHYCLGGSEPKYIFGKDNQIINCLHPALDSFLFKGLKYVINEFLDDSPKIPYKGFTTMRSKKEYDDILRFYRPVFAKYDAPLIVLEGFWQGQQPR